MIRILIGNIFESKMQAIVNTVNCVGVMGKGIAEEFKKKYPKMYGDYYKKCKEKKVRVGEPYLYGDPSGVTIINFPTKDHWRSPSRLDDIVKGLDYLVDHLPKWGINSIALPPLGCGNGGLEWALVGPIMYKKMNAANLPVEIYAPYGTPVAHLEKNFLDREINATDIKGRIQNKINPEWLVIIEVVEKLSKQKYSKPVGRVIFQKIAYLLTEQGVNTNFSFIKGSYGPYSDNLKNALKIYINSNLIKEQKLGRMVVVKVGSTYEELKNKHLDTINKYAKQIDKTVDLFSRIKNTDQAENVATIIYSTKELKKTNKDTSEKEVFEYILNWKKDWNTEEKKTSLVETIRNLEMLKWIRLKHSDSLPFYDMC